MCAKTHSDGNASMHMHRDTSELCCYVLEGHITKFSFGTGSVGGVFM